MSWPHHEQQCGWMLHSSIYCPWQACTHISGAQNTHTDVYAQAGARAHCISILFPQMHTYAHSRTRAHACITSTRTNTHLQMQEAHMRTKHAHAHATTHTPTPTRTCKPTRRSDGSVLHSLFSKTPMSSKKIPKPCKGSPTACLFALLYDKISPQRL